MRLLGAWALGIDLLARVIATPLTHDEGLWSLWWGVRRHEAHGVDFLLESFSGHLGSSSVLSPNSVPSEVGRARGGERGFWGQIACFRIFATS